MTATSREQWAQALRQAADAVKTSPWTLGDLLLEGERRWGTTYNDAAEVTGLANGTLRNIASIARRFPLSFRNDNLSWEHHRHVAPLEDAVAVSLLTRAAADDWSTREMWAEAMRHRNAERAGGAAPGVDTCNLDDLGRAVAEGRRFGCVLADPPWPYEDSNRSPMNHYRGMTLDEIRALPVAELVVPNAHVHLWVTNDFEQAGREIIDAWGFRLVSSRIWVKTREDGVTPAIGLGTYWRNAHETMLTAVRGDAPFRDHALPSVLLAPRREHSRKPDEMRADIERASPGPYLELFARGRPAPGWTAWGNQVLRADFHASRADNDDDDDVRAA